MKTYAVAIKNGEGTCFEEVYIDADSFEISDNGYMVLFKRGLNTCGFFKMDDIIGIRET